MPARRPPLSVDALWSIVRIGTPTRPIAKNVKAYEPIYQRYRALYPATRGLLVKH